MDEFLGNRDSRDDDFIDDDFEETEKTEEPEENDCEECFSIDSSNNILDNSGNVIGNAFNKQIKYKKFTYKEIEKEINEKWGNTLGISCTVQLFSSLKKQGADEAEIIIGKWLKTPIDHIPNLVT
jgi:GTP-binding protein EngB required for normal cell division